MRSFVPYESLPSTDHNVSSSFVDAVSASPSELESSTSINSPLNGFQPLEAFLHLNDTTFVHIANPEDMIDPFHSNQDFMTIVLTHAITFIVGVIGNSVVIATWARGGKIRSPTATFLVSLACADLLLLIIFMPLETLEYFVITWDKHGHICKLSSFVELLSGMSTILNLVAVSVERFLVIVYPIRARRWCTVTKSRRSLIFVWLLAVIFALPPVFNKSTHSMTYYNNVTAITAYYCFDRNDNWTIYFAIYELMTLFVIPAMLMVFCYFRVIRELWTSTRVITILTSSTNAYNASAQNAMRLNKDQSRSYLVRWPTKKLVSISVNCETSSSASDASAFSPHNHKAKPYRHSAPLPSPNLSFFQPEESEAYRADISTRSAGGNSVPPTTRLSLFKIFSCLRNIRAICFPLSYCVVNNKTQKANRCAHQHRCHYPKYQLNARYNDINKSRQAQVCNCSNCSQCLVSGIESEQNSNTSCKQNASTQMPSTVSITMPTSNMEPSPKVGLSHILHLCCRRSDDLQVNKMSQEAQKPQYEMQHSPTSLYLNLEDPNLVMTSTFTNTLTFGIGPSDACNSNVGSTSSKLISCTNGPIVEQADTPLAPVISPTTPIYHKAPVTNVRNARRQLYCQVIKMLLFIVILFHICWGPRLIFNVIKSAGLGNFDSYAYSARVYFYLLSFIHSALNPFVYGFMSSNFRRMMLNSCNRHHNNTFANNSQCQQTAGNSSLADAMANTSCLNMVRLKATSISTNNSAPQSSISGSDLYCEPPSGIIAHSSSTNHDDRCSQRVSSNSRPSDNDNVEPRIKVDSDDETSYSQIENEINQIVDSLQKSKQCHGTMNHSNKCNHKRFRLFDHTKMLRRSSSLFAFKGKRTNCKYQTRQMGCTSDNDANNNSIISLPKSLNNIEHSY